MNDNTSFKKLSPRKCYGESELWRSELLKLGNVTRLNICQVVTVRLWEKSCRVETDSSLTRPIIDFRPCRDGTVSFGQHEPRYGSNIPFLVSDLTLFKIEYGSRILVFSATIQRTNHSFCILSNTNVRVPFEVYSEL